MMNCRRLILNNKDFNYEISNIKNYLKELKKAEINGKSVYETVNSLEDEIFGLIAKICGSRPTFREEFDKLDNK